MVGAVGVHLVRSREYVDEIDALAGLLGGRVGLHAMLGDLNRRGRRTWLPLPTVSRAYTFDAADRRDLRWWPQGVSTSADASPTGEVAGREVVAVSWYARRMPGDRGPHHGSRVTFFDLGSGSYRHVLLVVPRLAPAAAGGRLELEPLRVHAGGIVWCGPWLHVAATARGFFSCRLEDLVRVPDHLAAARSAGLGVGDGRVATYGHRYLLPVRFGYRAEADGGQERLRYSFLSLDHESEPRAVIAGEYGRGGQTRRLARFPLDSDTLLLATDDDGVSRPLGLDEGVAGTQGAVVARGRYHLTVSHGPWVPGSVYVGQPGALHRHRWATPMGPEDVAYWPQTDELWSVTEHPLRRWLFAVRRSAFDG